MKLENSFTVPASPGQAWAVLLDVARIAPCMPGATLTEVDGDNFAGTVKVKVGPIALTYKGTAAFVEKNDAEHTAVIDAKGRETRGSGTANAKITAKLLPEGDGTRVEVITDLAITGRPAQFGRGVIGEVAGKVITQFADALAAEIADGTPVPAPEAPAETPPEVAEAAVPELADIAAAIAPQAAVEPEAVVTPPAVTPPAVTPPAVAPRRSAEAIDLLDIAGAPLAKRLAPVAAALALAALIILLVRRRT